VDLSNARVDLIKAENAVRLGIIVLNNAIGLPGTDHCTVEEDLSPVLADHIFLDAEKLAFESRPDLLSAQKQKSSAMESIKAAKRGHFPVINGTASITYVGTDFPLDHGWTAGVNMVVPIFSGFITSYRVAEAQANLKVAAANERTLRQTILLELEQGFLSLKEADARIKSSETSIRQARENLALANERYKTGLGIAVEVSDAILSYANAKMSNITARYDYKIAQAMIEKAVGGVKK
jgi:outer membrane protein TolC